MRQTIRTKGRLDSEVRPLHIGALKQGLRGPFLYDPPRLEDVAAVRHLQRPRRVLLDEEDRGALPVDLSDYLEDRVDQDRRQAQRWLVEEEQFWARHEGAANRQHLLFAPRECSGNLVAPLSEAWKEVEDPLFVAPDGGGILAHVGAEKKIVPHRHAGKDPATLWCVANAAHHDLHVVFDQEDGDALLSHLFDESHQVALLLRIGARGRLVEQDQAGIARQGSGDLEPPLVPVRQVARIVVSLLPDANELEELVGPLRYPLLLPSRFRCLENGVPKFRAHTRVLADPHVVERRHVGEQPDLLKGAADAEPGDPVGLERGDVSIPDLDRTRGRLVHPGNGVEHGRLPGAVGANQREDLAFGYGETDIVDGRQAAEALGHSVDGQDRLRGRRGPLRTRHSVPSRRSKTVSSVVPFSSSCSRIRLGNSPCGRSNMTITRISPKTM